EHEKISAKNELRTSICDWCQWLSVDERWTRHTPSPESKQVGLVDTRQKIHKRFKRNQRFGEPSAEIRARSCLGLSCWRVHQGTIQQDLSCIEREMKGTCECQRQICKVSC